MGAGWVNALQWSPGCPKELRPSRPRKLWPGSYQVGLEEGHRALGPLTMPSRYHLAVRSTSFLSHSQWLESGGVRGLGLENGRAKDRGAKSPKVQLFQGPAVDTSREWPPPALTVLCPPASGSLHSLIHNLFLAGTKNLQCQTCQKPHCAYEESLGFLLQEGVTELKVPACPGALIT